MQAAFSILLDPPLYNYVRNLQTKIYELFSAKDTLKLEPHFTLKYKFETNGLKGVEDYFDELLERTESFEVHLNGINTFEDGDKVIFLNVEKSETLTNLHLKVLGDLSQKFQVMPGEFEGKDLHFHITLAYKDISDETFQQILEYLKDEKPTFRFMAKRLALYLLPDSNINWFIYKIGSFA